MNKRVRVGALEPIIDPYFKPKKTKAKDAFHANLRSKSNRDEIAATVKGISKKHTEALAKITSYSNGSKQTRNHLTYITRNKSLETENQAGETFSHKDEISLAINELCNAVEDEKKRKNGRTGMHLTLSMPKGTDPEKVKRAARNVLHDEFEQHDYLFVLHTDQPHPHVHAFIRTQDRQGKRLRVGKEDLFRYRRKFAAELRALGVEAIASSRTIRGQYKKGERTEVFQIIERRDSIDAKSFNEPSKSWVKNNRLMEAIDEVKGVSKKQPWKKVMALTKERLIAELSSSISDVTVKKTVSIEESEKDGQIPSRSINTGLYQPYDRVIKTRILARTQADLRSLPNGDVVHRRRKGFGQLLSGNARARVRPRRANNHEMRRSDSGIERNAGSEVTVSDVKALIDNLRDAKIRTMHDDLVSALKNKFVSQGKEAPEQNSKNKNNNDTTGTKTQTTPGVKRKR